MNWKAVEQNKERGKRVEKKINFNEMNPYVRFVQYTEGSPGFFHVPCIILYDNFLMFVTEGYMILKFDNKEIEIHENELCIIPPFMRNKLEAPKEIYSWYYGVHFDFFYDDSEKFNEDVYLPEKMGYEYGTLFEMPVEESLSHRNVYQPEVIQFPEKIRIHRHTALRKLLEKLFVQFEGKEFGYEILMKATFYEIFHLIIQEINDAENFHGMDNFSAILRYMQDLANECDEKTDITKIAMEYGMTPQKFRVYFKKQTSRTPKEYLIDCKVEHGKELLLTGKYKVSEVAYMLGYDDVFYFSKLFKRKTGITPKNYIDKGKIKQKVQKNE